MQTKVPVLQVEGDGWYTRQMSETSSMLEAVSVIRTVKPGKGSGGVLPEIVTRLMRTWLLPIVSAH